MFILFLLVVNLTFSPFVYVFEAVIEDNGNLKLFCKSSVKIGLKQDDLSSSIELFEGSFLF